MLPAGSARRLVSILTQALEDCAAQKKKLEDNLTLCWTLLEDWKVQTPESPKPENCPKGDQESEPSPKELEDLEMLNRALEKALRVRKSTLRNPSEALGAAEGKKATERKPATSAVRTQQAPLSKESVPKTIKVTSVHKKAASSKKVSSYMLKAPYRTDPVKAPTSQSFRAPKVAGKGLTKGVAFQQARKIVPAPCVSQQEFCTAAEPSGSPRSPLQQSSSSIGGSASGKNSVAVILQGADPENDYPGSLAESPVAQSHTAGDTTMGSTTARTFNLQEKGSLLKLPLPYRKAYSRNSRLWEKCHLCQSNSATAAAPFLERMQATFCSSAPAFSPAEIEKEVNVLRDVHSLLSQYMEAELTGHPTWKREYECLLTLEGLQDSASQCLHKLQLLRAAAESQMLVHPADCAHSAGTSPADCAPLRGRRCRDAGVLATPLLFYSSFQELRDMAALKLQVVMLRQQINIQKVLIEELLPILESRLPCDDSASHLYRAVYTQLCEGGERFPVLMNDELPD